jgi:phosphotransferase system enzyme I (PtsI)
MQKFQGKGAFGAIAIGKISVFKKSQMTIEKEFVENISAEADRLDSAREACFTQLDELYERSLESAGKQQAELFTAYKMILLDDYYIESIKDIIKAENVNAEYAVDETAKKFEKLFSDQDDDYMSQRAIDIRDISDRLIANLRGDSLEVEISDEGVIVCADELTPSDTVSMDAKKVLAFATAGGSLNSHAAILAANMGIPAIVGIGDEFINKLKTGEEAIADGFTGELILNPDSNTKEFYLNKKKEAEDKKKQLENLKGKPNLTKSGRHVDIFANIGNADQSSLAIENDAGGIGLLRSEYLYLEGKDYPSEEEQFGAYKYVLEKMNGKKVIIRTLDIGADKQAEYFHLKKEENPALGLRAIRICLTRPEIFKVQLRALYRASVYGKLGIMFPMVASVSELEQILKICEEVRQSLKAEKIAFSPDVELGIMIETPAAAIISDLLAPMVDFFSIGTNDLTQYTLACDRQNSALESFCDTHHEAVLRLIELTAKNAHAHGTSVGICGELAADTTLTKTFLDWGIDELSVSPGYVLKLREHVRELE